MNKEEQLARWWADNLGDVYVRDDDTYADGKLKPAWIDSYQSEERFSIHEYLNDKNVVARALEWVEEQNYFSIDTPTVVPQEQIADAIGRTKDLAWNRPAKMLLELAKVCGFKCKYE